MKWTQRDTSYLVAILAPSLLLISLLFGDRILPKQRLMKSDVQPEPFVMMGPAVPQEQNDDENVVVIDGKMRVRKMESPPERVEHRVIEISEGMAREELAKALGVSVEDLPPNYQARDTN